MHRLGHLEAIKVKEFADWVTEAIEGKESLEVIRSLSQEGVETVDRLIDYHPIWLPLTVIKGN